MEEQSTASQPSPVDAAVSRVAGALQALGPDCSVQAHAAYVEAVVPVSALEEAARILKADLGYVLLSMVTAIDFPESIEVVYLAYALDHANGILLKTSLPREDLPSCPTLTGVWRGAEFQEREVYDLMGVNFVGHPDMTRILTEDDFPGHPLRKDFSIEPDYVLMRHLRFGVEGQLTPAAESEPATEGQTHR